jgi:hypothetical protein
MAFHPLARCFFRALATGVDDIPRALIGQRKKGHRIAFGIKLRSAQATCAARADGLQLDRCSALGGSREADRLFDGIDGLLHRAA